MENSRIAIPDWCMLSEQGAHIPIRIVLHGFSMQPFIRRAKDHVTIVPHTQPTKRGDIILYQRSDNEYVVHRVYRMKNQKIQTIGDRYFHADEWIDEKAILGDVIAVERGNRFYRVNTALARFLGRTWTCVRPFRKLFSLFRCAVCSKRRV